MAERLTVSGATTQRDIDRLMELSNCNQFGRNGAYYKLQHYEDLEEQNRLIELPCAVGDTVYFIGADGVIIEKATRTIEEVMNYKPIIGKGCYLTRKEAEERLKGEKNEV